MPTGARGRAKSDEEKTVRQGPPPDPTGMLAQAIEIFNDDFKSLKLAGKIAVISGHLGRIPKNGHNNFNNYDYVLESDLVEAIRWYLAACRILIYQSVKEHTVHTFDGVMVAGRQRDILTDVVYTFVVVDGTTGETFSFDMLGQGMDPRDKGSNKASTSAMKFAYMRLFNVSSGEDPEKDERGDMAAALGSGQVGGVTVTPGNVPDAQRGGKQEKATATQIKAVSNLSNQLGLGGPGLVGVIDKTLGLKVELPQAEAEHGKALAAVLKEMQGEDIGKVIYALQEAVRAVEAEHAGDSGYGS